MPIDEKEGVSGLRDQTSELVFALAYRHAHVTQPARYEADHDQRCTTQGPTLCEPVAKPNVADRGRKPRRERDTAQAGDKSGSKAIQPTCQEHWQRQQEAGGWSEGCVEQREAQNDRSGTPGDHRDRRRV